MFSENSSSNLIFVVLLMRKFIIQCIMVVVKLKEYCLWISPSCQMMSETIFRSINTAAALKPLFNATFVSVVILISWSIVETCDVNPFWYLQMRSESSRYWFSSFYIIVSQIHAIVFYECYRSVIVWNEFTFFALGIKIV